MVQICLNPLKLTLHVHKVKKLVENGLFGRVGVTRVSNINRYQVHVDILCLQLGRVQQGRN